MRVGSNRNSEELTQEKRSILIVEDDIEIREALQDFLECCDYTVHSAANGKIALEILEKIPPPSLILLDLIMPTMNGWEFAHELGKNETLSSIPIVVMTAMPDKIIGINSKNILRKPLDINLLLPTIESHF